MIVSLSEIIIIRGILLDRHGPLALEMRAALCSLIELKDVVLGPGGPFNLHPCRLLSVIEDPRQSSETESGCNAGCNSGCYEADLCKSLVT